MTLLLGVTGFAAAAQALDVPGWVYMLGSIVGSGFVFRAYLVRSEKRLGNAKANLSETETKQLEDNIRRALATEVEESLQRSRREIQEARADEAEAIAEVAKLVAAHERDRSHWQDERHRFINEAKDRDLKISNLTLELSKARGEIDQLRDEVRSLRIDRGLEDGRRAEDPPAAA